MTDIGNTISENGTESSVPVVSQKSGGGAAPRFLVNIINKRELELLEELLKQNAMEYVVRNASRKGSRSANGGFAMLGKDIYVDSAHYDRAKAALADYYLGGEQTTAETNAVPASRRQQAQLIHRRRYPVKQLIFWLVLATVGYSALFMIWMSLMKK